MVLENEMPFHKQHCLRLNQPPVCGEKGKSGGIGVAEKDNRGWRVCEEPRSKREKIYDHGAHKGLLALSKWPWE